MNAYKITVIAKRHKPLCRLKTSLLTYHLGGLYNFDLETWSKRKICDLPISKRNLLIGRFRLFERILRLEPRCAIELQDGLVLVSFQGAIYSVNIKTKVIHREHAYRIGMKNPLILTKIEGIKGFDDCIAYGEYFGNKRKESVAVYVRSILKNDWRKVFEFPPKTINHIHAIIPDPFRDSVIILTGDDNEGSGMWFAKNGFNEVKTILNGEQVYRTCNVFPMLDGILYATDTPLEKNNILFTKETTSGWKTQRLSSLNGSCIYSTRIGENYLFSTTVEPDSCLKGLKYLLSYKLGPGINGWNSEIVVGNIIDGFKKVVCFKKDFLPMALCQFGSVNFCGSSNENYTFAYPVSVLKYDAKMIKIELR